MAKATKKAKARKRPYRDPELFAEAVELFDVRRDLAALSDRLERFLNGIRGTAFARSWERDDPDGIADLRALSRFALLVSEMGHSHPIIPPCRKAEYERILAD